MRIQTVMPNVSPLVSPRLQRALRPAAVSAAVLALAACSVLPTPPVQSVRYDLGLPPVTAATAQIAPQSSLPLVMAEVQSAAGADNSTAMHYRLLYANDQERRSYQTARWSQPPVVLLEQSLRTRLAQERPVLAEKDNLSLANADQRPLGVLRLEVVEFSQLFDSASSSQATVSVRASLIGQDRRGGNVLLGQQLFTAQTPAASADAAGGAKAMATSVQQLGDQINQWLRSLNR